MAPTAADGPSSSSWSVSLMDLEFENDSGVWNNNLFITAPRLQLLPPEIKTVPFFHLDRWVTPCPHWTASFSPVIWLHPRYRPALPLWWICADILNIHLTDSGYWLIVAQVLEIHPSQKKLPPLIAGHFWVSSEKCLHPEEIFGFLSFCPITGVNLIVEHWKEAQRHKAHGQKSVSGFCRLNNNILLVREGKDLRNEEIPL